MIKTSIDIMFNYKIYGVVLGSDIEIPQLIPAAEDEKAEIFLKKADFSEEERRKHTEEYSIIGKELSSFYNEVLICVVEHGERILYEPMPCSDMNNVRAYILGYGLSMLFLQRKKLAVHCSGIRMGDKAIMISGGSGAGKSSLTRQFLSNGYQLMADDVMIAGVEKMIRDGQETEKALAYPAFPFTKLCADVVEREHIDTNGLEHITENKDKYLIPYDGSFSCEPAELEALCILVVLAPEAEVQTKEIKGVGKLKLLIDNLFIGRSIMFYENNPLAVSLAAQLASHIRVILIGRPDGKDTTREQYQALMKKLF